MNKFKIFSLCTVVVLIASSSVALYSKNVQAKGMIDNFKNSLAVNNYEEALAIETKVNSDIILKKMYSFNNTAKSLINEEYVSLKNDYLDDKITYDDLSLNISQLEALDNFKLTIEEKQKLESIENLRGNYRNAEDLFEGSNYAASVNILKGLENSIDDTYKPKVQELEKQISDKVSESIESSITRYLVKKKYNEALKVLEDNKPLLTEDLYNKNLEEINNYKNKIVSQEEIIRKAEEERKKQLEEQKKKALEEAKKQEDIQLASYLSGYTPNPEKESMVQNLSSRTKFLVWVDLPSQTTNIFVGSKGNWKLIKSFLSSTGKPGDETPKGSFTIKSRGKWFFSEKYQEGGKYWVQIFGNYLFHSLPMNINQQVVDPTLGVPASHGCIRLGLNDIQWFYNNIKSGTTVYIK